MKRNKISKHASHKVFTKYADRTHIRNVAPPPQRGGIRL